MDIRAKTNKNTLVVSGSNFIAVYQIGKGRVFFEFRNIELNNVYKHIFQKKFTINGILEIDLKNHASKMVKNSLKMPVCQNIMPYFVKN